MEIHNILGQFKMNLEFKPITQKYLLDLGHRNSFLLPVKIAYLEMDTVIVKCKGTDGRYHYLTIGGPSKHEAQTNYEIYTSYRLENPEK
jgi:hypothetical protein